MVVGNQLRPDQPPVIGAKIAASYCAGSGGLDGLAALNRDWANRRHPLIHSCRGDFKFIRQCFLAAKYITGFLYSAHGANYSVATDVLQAMLQKHFVSVAI